MFDRPVVFVDIETTGGSYRNSRVLEVAAIRYENGEVTKEYTSLINPQTHIPTSITSLTGIREMDIVGAPIFMDIADELAEIMQDAIFVAHNVRFDYSFLKQEFAMVGINFSPKLFCTVRLSRYLYAQRKGHSLAVLIERHRIPVLDRHRALADARAILYFSQLAYDEHGESVFAEAVQRQLKTQYLPPNLDIDELSNIGNIPGVYIFRDHANQPVYVGKSVTLKKRILSHFQDSSAKEIKLSQEVHHVETIPTGSELGALILESKLIKDMMPVYNRQLRRISLYAMLIKTEVDGYASVSIRSGNVDPETDMASIYGLYKTRTQAKKSIEEMTRTFGLCPKRMGIEKTNGACFSYSLGKCKGACIGRESAELYNQRFEIALQHHRIATWPYQSAIIVPINTDGEQVIINNWIVQGYLTCDGEPMLEDSQPTFDFDEYKIIRHFIRENNANIKMYLVV